MKSKLKPIIICGVVGAMALAGCTGDNNNHDPVIDMSVDAYQVVVKDIEVEGYDWASLFTVTADGVKITLDDSHIDYSAVSSAAGSYTVVCTYGDKTETIEVIVVATTRSVEFANSVQGGEITLTGSDVDGFDFKSLFVVKEDGQKIEITDAMVQTDVASVAGVYTYTVSYGGMSKTLTVNVVDDVLIVPSYKTAEIPESELDGYDFTKLFSLYVEGKAVRVTTAMVDASATENAEVGKSYTVRFSYTYAEKAYTLDATVKIVADEQFAVSSRNIEIYPHSGAIDVTTLFEIKQGDRIIPVTADMITGEIDYTTDGENDTVSTLTLHFDGHEYTATVTVKSGVVIGYRSTDTVAVTKGTDEATYPFSNDFVVTINGVRFFAIPESYFVGLEAVDFDAVGEYTVTLRIPYSDKPLGLGSVDFDYFEKDIKYVVREYNSIVRVVNPSVVLSRGTASYNPFSNILVNINGREQVLTTHKDWVDALTCYAEVLSDDVDLSSAATQPVRIAIYDQGVDAQPTVVSFTVTVDAGVTVTAHDAGVFSGSTLYTTDLFEITDNGKNVVITADMISGKVDTFTPGVYEITVTYKGMEAVAVVTVFDGSMKGTYKTLLTTIPPEADDDDDDSGDWGYGDDDWGGGSEYYSNDAQQQNSRAAAGTTRYGDLVIKDDGSIVVNGNKAEIIGGEDESVLRVKIGSNKYTMHIDNGIVVLDPDNEFKLGFSDYRRPLIYFNSEVWKLKNKLEINYSDNYVLTMTYATYSIDAFEIESVETGESMWYGMKVHLVEKSSADTSYRVSWGEVTFADDFVPVANASSSLEFLGETYNFTMTSNDVAKVAKKDNTISKFIGKTFTGMIDGNASSLIVGSGNSFSLRNSQGTVFSYTINDFGNNKNSYIDELNDEVFLYKCDRDSTPFSYKFKLDTQSNTFTLVEKDLYYGKYETDTMFVFLDGYGTGIINFNKATFTNTQFRYAVNSSVVTITYINTSPSFAYGESAEFYMGELLNTLKVKRFETDLLDGEVFENSFITDGAIVKTTKHRFGAAIGDRTADQVKSEIRNSITVITKNGEVSASDKASSSKDGYIDVSKVGVSFSGYYRVAITVNVGGEKVTSYYSVQIVKGDLVGNALVGDYNGICHTDYTFSVDINGMVEIRAVGKDYTGYAEKSGDELVFKAYSADGGHINGVISSVASNLIKIDVSGSVNYSDYYAKSGLGSSRVVGIVGTVLREITVKGGEKVYILASSALTTGEIVTITSLSDGSVDNGSTVKLEKADGSSMYFNIIKWGDVNEGITVLNNYVEQ